MHRSPAMAELGPLHFNHSATQCEPFWIARLESRARLLSQKFREIFLQNLRADWVSKNAISPEGQMSSLLFLGAVGRSENDHPGVRQKGSLTQERENVVRVTVGQAVPGNDDGRVRFSQQFLELLDRAADTGGPTAAFGEGEQGGRFP